jgi:UPF0755 protein
MSLSRRHKILLICLSIFLLFVSPLIYFLLIPPSYASRSKTILIKKGLSLREISALLEQEGIIRNMDFFIGMATLLGKKGEIKAGEYEFHTRMLPHAVLSSLIKGQVKQYLVTVPEGYTLSQISQLLEDLGIVGKTVFLEKATSPAFIASLGLSEYLPNQVEDSSKKRGGMTLEGYLFPDTYHFIREMEPEEVIRMMTHQFRKIFDPALIEKAFQMGISPREAVTLASIIEKETSLSEEKPIVSSVFHNRLKRKMPLQSDPTVIYGIRNFDGNLTKEHLLTPSPFNTYLYVGLPPTPICNPGKDSIMAALNPASSSYLYFVSRNDGSHQFSENYEDHKRAVGKYQQNISKKSP